MFIGEGWSLEKLNLYSGRKVKKVKFKTFILLIFISLVPALSIYLGSNTWRMLSIQKTISKYPKVFSQVKSTDTNGILSELGNLSNSIKQKNLYLEQKSYTLENSVSFIFKSTEYLKILGKNFSNSDNKFFISQVNSNKDSFSVEFYEFGSTLSFSTSTVYEELSRYYKEVQVEFVEEKQILNGLYYFKWNLGGKM